MSMGETCDHCGVWCRGSRACSASDSKEEALREQTTCPNLSYERRQMAREEYIERYLGWHS